MFRNMLNFYRSLYDVTNGYCVLFFTVPRTSLYGRFLRCVSTFSRCIVHIATFRRIGGPAINNNIMQSAGGMDSAEEHDNVVLPEK